MKYKLLNGNKNNQLNYAYPHNTSMIINPININNNNNN